MDVPAGMHTAHMMHAGLGLVHALAQPASPISLCNAALPSPPLPCRPVAVARVQVRHTGYVILSHEGETEAEAERGPHAGASSTGEPPSAADGAPAAAADASPSMDCELETGPVVGLGATSSAPPSMHAWRLEQDVRGNRGVGWLELGADD